MKIVLFEDTNDRAEQLLTALRGAVQEHGEVVRFEGVRTDGVADDRLYEIRIVEALQGPPYANATLIVADRDLSKTRDYTGLSESAVRRAADDLLIPECSYSRNAEDTPLTAAAQREACITVPATADETCAVKVVAVAKGFQDIFGKLPPQLAAEGRKSPGKTLAGVLGKPEYADKIALYASGDQNRLADVVSLKGADANKLQQSLKCLLGYWLWDSVLRFPGVVVNQVAAASYLNIHKDDFSGDVLNLFSEAKYAGPFADAKEPLWWRGMLDDSLSIKECVDGRALILKQMSREVRPSACCENAQQPAGFYCMLTGQAVSFENSRGGLPWFPRGADLARVSKSAYEQLGPWL